VPLSLSSVIWYQRTKGGDVLWLGRLPQAWQKVIPPFAIYDGDVAQWLERWSLNGELSLIYT